MIQGRPVTSHEEAEVLRQLRNAGRQWATVDQSEIEPGRQGAWWDIMKDAEPVNFRPLLYRDESGATVGFGVIHRRYRKNELVHDRGHLWATVGVHPGARGRGHGAAIYADLRRRAAEPLHLEILRDDRASLRVASRAGFQVHSDTPRTIILVAGIVA